MPVIEVKMLAGRSLEKKSELAEKLTAATDEALEIIEDGIHVIIQDVLRDNWARGGVQFSERK